MINPQILPRNKLSLHLILPARSFPTKQELCAFSPMSSQHLSMLPFLRFLFSSLTCHPPHTPPSPPTIPPHPTPDSSGIQRQSGKVVNTDPPFPFVDLDFSKKCNTYRRENRDISESYSTLSVSVSLRLKGELVFPFYVILFSPMRTDGCVTWLEPSP